MKRLIFLICIICLGSFSAFAQKDTRTSSTRIADVLAQMPADNGADFNTAMKEMEGLGQNGLTELAEQLNPDPKVDNSKLQYALMGYTTYVGAPGKETLKREAEKAWINALTHTKDQTLSIFYMDMLSYIGTDDAVSALAGELKDGSLGLKASTALASIGTPKAGEALKDALSGNNTSNEYLIQALGNMKYKGALPQLAQYAQNGSPAEKQAALYALSEIGDPSSAQIMKEATKEGGKVFTNKNTTALYDIYLRNLAKSGSEDQAGKLADEFVRQTNDNDVLSRTAALNALVAIKKSNAINTLATAAYDKNSEYRNAALNLALPYITKSTLPLFVKDLKKAPAEVQANLIQYLSKFGDSKVSQLISRYASGSSNTALKQASILALAENGNTGVTEQLLKILKKSPAQDLETIQQGLLIAGDNNISSKLLSVLHKFSGGKKVVLMNVLGDKKYTGAFNAIAGQLNSSDPDIKEAAFTALPRVAGADALPALFNLLRNAGDQKEIGVLQTAIDQVLEKDNKEEAGKIIFDQLKTWPADKQDLLFPSLNTLGTGEALSVVYAAYKKGGSSAGDALKALTSWKNADAMNHLFSIANEAADSKDKEAALEGYIKLIPSAKVPAEEQLLLLKKAMKAASADGQKKLIIGEASAIPSFSSMAFVANFLENPNLKNDAASAILNIVSNDESLHGTLVKGWLKEAMQAIEGRDAPYLQKSIQKYLDEMPDKEGFVSMFNGKDLTGWKGLVGDPVTRQKMSREELNKAQEDANETMRKGWAVKDGVLVFLGKGDNIATNKEYGNFEMLVDWKIFDDGQKDGDAGIYLRGTPQVQIWDTSRTNVGAQVGSGGLYNNQKYRSTPLAVADNKLGEWNHFDIRMVDDKVTVYLNGVLVTDKVPLENYWDRNMPLWPEEQIELQAHGSRVGYRDLYIKELPSTQHFKLSKEEKNEGFEVLFDGTNLDKWEGNKTDYVIDGTELVIHPKPGSRGNLYTKEEFKDFDFRFEFKLTPGANNGVGIRAPLTGDAAYVGMEIQILDNGADIYKQLEPYQYHGSVYGVIPAKRGFLKPVGEWNYEEIIAVGPKIKVILNGETIVDGDITDARKHGTMDGKSHPGLNNVSGHIGFLGHGSVVHFRNIRVKEL